MLKKIGIISCAAVMCAVSTAAAAPIDNVIQDAEIGKLTISGELSAGGEFTVQVLKKDKQAEDLNNISNTTVKDIIQAMDIFETEKEKYTINVVLGKNAESGSYLIRINGTGLEKPYEYTYEKYYNVAEIQELFKQITGGSAAEILNLLNSAENREILGLPVEDIYKNMSDSAKEAVAGKIYEDKTSDGDKAKIETVEDLRECFKEGSVLIGITYAQTGEKAAKILKQYGKDVGFSGYAKYESFMSMTEEEQSVAGKRLMGRDFKNSSNREALFNEAIILAELENALGAADFKEKLSENKDYFESGALDGYLNMQDSSSADSKIIAEISNADSLNALAEKIKNILSENTQKPSGGSGNSGSSGGSGGGISVTAPADNTLAGSNAAFGDMQEASWAETAVNYLYKKGIVNGKSENMFCPNDLVKREEFVKMLVVAFDLNGEAAEPNFYDVNKSDWYYDYIVRAYKSGIVTGVSAEKFGVGEYITRQDMAVMIYRIIKNNSAALENVGILGFTDKNDISEYAREAVAYLRAAGVISGMDDGSFKPTVQSTRAQAANVIYKAVKFAEGGV